MVVAALGVIDLGAVDEDEEEDGEDDREEGRKKKKRKRKRMAAKDYDALFGNPGDGSVRFVWLF